jgi:putative ABC transport system permease protein
MFSDLRYALRSLFRSPGFSIAAIFTIALGMGANTAIFSVADAILLRPLPYPHADRLVMVWNQLTKLGLDRLSPESHSAKAYRSLNVFENSGGMYEMDRILGGAGESERVPSMIVTSQLFPMLGAKTIAGRLFTPDEYLPNAPRVAILSAAFFARRFGSDASIVGKSISVDERDLQVVGVLAPDFSFGLRTDADLWTPKVDTEQSWGNSTRMVALLKPGVSLTAAQSALDAAARHVEDEFHPYRGPHGEEAGYRVKAVLFREQFLGNFRAITWILLAAVGAVLLIACANVANLFLVRAVAREKETAVRRALGATSADLFQQWLMESAILASLGGAIGSVAAVWGVKILLRLNPASLPGMAKIAVNGRAFAFTFVVSAVVCLLFGLVPSLTSSRIMWGARGAIRRSRRAASSFIAMEVALAVMLLISAGLLTESFSKLIRVNPGFNPVHLLTMRVQFAPNVPVMRNRVLSFYPELRDRLAEMPGVSGATLGGMPLRGGVLNAHGGDPFALRGKSYGSGGDQFANLNTVGLDYFRTLEIPLLSGRTFSKLDTGDAPRLVMVNESLAKKFFPAGAVGQEIGIPKPCRDLSCDFDWATIIGVAGDVKTIALDQPALPMLYMAFAQNPFPAAGVMIRTEGDPLAMARAVASVVRSLDPAMPVFDVETMDQRVSEALGQPRFQTVLVGFFALAALFLAAIGIFGVVAHSTAQRTQEIGIRMALGAGAARVVETVLFDGLRPVVFGVLLGLAGAAALSHILRSLLFQTSSMDPLIFFFAAIVLTLVAIAACLGPARRATKVDPMVALRAE